MNTKSHVEVSNQNQAHLLLQKSYLYYEQSRYPIANSNIETFLNNLQSLVDTKEYGFQHYEEVKSFFPVKLSSKTIILMVPNPNREKNDMGLDDCDIFIYNPEEYTYTTLLLPSGVREIFSEHGIPTNHFLMDGFLGIQVKEAANLEVITGSGMILSLFPSDITPSGDFPIEQLEHAISLMPDLFEKYDQTLRMFRKDLN